MIHMRACGDFGHNSAIGPMHFHLREHQVGQHSAISGDDRCRGFITTGFDPQDQGMIFEAICFRMTGGCGQRGFL